MVDFIVQYTTIVGATSKAEGEVVVFRGANATGCGANADAADQTRARRSKEEADTFAMVSNVYE